MKEIGSCQEFLEKRGQMIGRGALYALSAMSCTDPRSHSEDVSSEVTQKVISHWDGLDSPEHVLHTIIIHTARDHIRKCRAEVSQEIDESATPCFDQVQAGRDPEQKLFELLLLGELMRRLSQAEQRVILLRLDGYSFDFIGEILHMPSGTVRSIKSRAVKKMRKLAVS